MRREVGRDLWADAQLSEADFTVLAELAAAPNGTMRSTGCARALGWDTGRFSHQLKRMEERGLVQRGRGEAGDGRAAVVTLTDEGRTAYRKALGPHMRSAKSWFLEALDPEQVEQLDATLQTLLDHVHKKAEHTK
ncbi:MarR family winged helix-turn-helix transcriptional regulator [Actinoplanes sp. NPDC049596]|uniref:MarR family winged helix-turn-helix transcriptional regulator n=1 Tax=unclassified Actinoplanes TaxID=2626549 RepID=UPI0034193280